MKLYESIKFKAQGDKMKSVFATICIVCLTSGFVSAHFASAHFASAQTLYQEQDGLVVIEIETAPPAGEWKPEQELEGFTGEGYYTWCGPDRFKQPGTGILSYNFLVTLADSYRLAIRNRHDFEDRSEENDCFTSIDGGPWVKTFSSQRGKWSWNTNHEFSHANKPLAQYELTAGVHNLRLSGRSQGFSIDRIHLYREDAQGKNDATHKETKGLPSLPEIEHFPAIAKLVHAGQLGKALELANENRDVESIEAQQEATKCADLLHAHGQEQRKIIAVLESSNTVLACDFLDLLAKQYSGSELGSQFGDDAKALAKDPAIAKERKAQAMYQEIHRVASLLVGKGTINDQKFVARYSRELNYISSGLKKLHSKYPDTSAYASALEIATKLGFQPPE